MATTYSLAKFTPVRNSKDGKDVISTYVDFTTAGKAGLPSTGLGTSDTLQVCNIGENCVVTNVIIDVRTVEGAGDTIDVGYGDSTAYWHNNVSVNSAVCTASSSAPLAFAADDTIDITGLSAAVNTAKIWIHVEFIRTSMENA